MKVKVIGSEKGLEKISGEFCNLFMGKDIDGKSPWYRNYVGQKFYVFNKVGDLLNVECVHDSEIFDYIHKEDCEIIED